MRNKRIEKIIYGFMTLLVLLQIIMPVVVLAETQDTDLGTISLTKATLTGDTQETFLNLDGDIQTKNQKMTEQMTILEGIKFIPENNRSIEIKNASIEVQPDKLDLSAEANTNEHFTFKVKIESSTIRDNKLTIKLGQQEMTVEVPDSLNQTVLNSIAKDSDQTSTSSLEVQSTDESTLESKTASSVPEKETSSSMNELPQKKVPGAKVGTGNDIRDYFPNGNGTIIDNATVSYYDKDGNELTPPVPADAEVRIHYDWSIPEDIREKIKPGDQFTFNLPDGVKPKDGQSGELKGPDGTVYATYEMDENGQVVITFNENVTNEVDINGSFDFSTEFDTTHIDGPGDHEITFPTEDELPPIEVEVKPATDTSISKSGHFDRTPNPSQVTWDVDFNQGMNSLSDPTITEKWPAGLTYDSVKVYELIMNLDGTVEKVGRELSPSEFTVDADGNVTILGDTSKAYRVEYVTNIDEKSIPDDGGDVSYTNQATLTDKNNPDHLDAEATVTNKFGKMLEKNQTGYDPDNQEFTWEIKYNYGEKEVDKDDATITDDMSSNMTLSEDPVIYPITFGPNGEEIKGSTPLVEGTDYKLVKNPNGDGFVIEFLHDIDGAYKIEYKTKVDGTVTDPTKVENKVRVGTGETDEDHGTAEQQNVIKSLDKNSIDYENKTVDWVVQVNNNHYEMHDLVLTDKFSPVPGLELIQTPELNAYRMTVTSSSGVTLVQGVDYTIVPTYNNESQQTGYELKFIGKYNPTSESFTVRYTTQFHTELIDPNDPSLDHFTNEINADWTSEDGEHHHSDDKDEFKPNPDFTLNAEKSGSYNAQTKTIKWQIAVNLSGNILKDAFLSDQIKDNQKYVSGSLKVYEAHTDSDGTVKKDNDQPDNDKMISIEEPAVKNRQTFDIHFPNQSQHTYLIEFETSLVGQVIEESKEYDNHATYSNDDKDRDVVGKVSVNNGGNHVEKSGEQDEEEPNYVDWHITINAAQSKLNDVVVTDKPSNNQIIDENSIKIYGTTVEADGTVTPDKSNTLVEGVDYTLVLTTDNITGDQVLTVKFLHEISQAYYMEYRALINSSTEGQDDTVTNEANITGEGTKTVTDDSGEDVTVEIDHSGGSASGTKGRITLQKVAENQSTILTGAHFQLWDVAKTQILREGDVDKDGKITFGNLKMGDYLLVETKAPDGYTITDDLVQGRKISISPDTSVENALPTKIVNGPNKVILTKSGEHKEKLANAEFRLEQQLGSLWLPVSVGGLITNTNGQLEIDSLKLGHYRLIETKAPDGYMINNQPLEFTVSKNSQNQISEVDLKMVDYQGSATLVKQDEKGTPLAGATFKITDTKGKLIQTGLVSDDKGRVSVSDLAPGKYFFVETKAPNGFVLNTHRYPFTIKESAIEKPDTVTVENAINYQGSAELHKEDEFGNPLSGATFKVIDEKGQMIQTGLVSDKNGLVTVDGLAPGNYQFIETKAPDGYILNTKKIDFTIDAENRNKPVIVKAGTMTNYQGSVKIRKVNTAHETLAGAEFTLYNEDHKKIASTVSKKDGWIKFDHLAPGIYFLVETKAPSLPDGTDYVINPYPIRVLIANKADGKPAELNLGEFQNFKGKAEIQKIGKNGSIAGAEFTLYEIVDGQEKILKNVTAPETGILPLNDLGAGQYKLVETKAAPGYIINSQPVYFVVDPNIKGNTDHLDFENYQSKIIAKKIDGDGLIDTGLSGATFQIFEQDKNGNKGNGPLSIIDQDGRETDTLISRKDGEISASGLGVGKYLLVEKKSPVGYVLNSKEFPFEIKEQQGKPKVINLGEIKNYRGQIDIIKSDDRDKLLEGGTFVLSNDPLGKGKVDVIDSHGKKTSSLHAIDGHIKAKGIRPGVYYLVETKAPKGFIINSTPIKIVIPNERDGNSNLKIEGNLVNYQGSAKLKKIDSNHNALSDAQFNVIDANGKIVKSDLISDKSGRVQVNNLAPGKYSFVEVKAPKGYQLSNETRDFIIENKIADKPSVVNVKDFINNKLTSKKSVENGKNNSSKDYQARFPKTGEDRNKKLLIIGIVIFFSAMVLILKRKNYQEDSTNKKF